jgi:hypothetical protein
LRTILTLGLLLCRYESDLPGATPCDLRTLKHFAELLATAAEGQLEEKPTVDTVRGYMRRFTSGYERDTGICIPEQVRKSVTNVSAASRGYYYLVPVTNGLMLTDEKHIKTTFKIKLGLSTAHRSRHYLTLKKYKILVLLSGRMIGTSSTMKGLGLGSALR